MCKKLVVLSVAILVAAPAITNAASIGPVGWWKFDETSGSVAADSSGSGLDGALLPATGGPVWVTGKLGGALKFNGTTDSVDLGNKAAFNMGGSFTITLWANIGAWTSGWGCVMMGNRGEDNIGWQIRRYSNDRLCFTTRGMGSDDTSSNLTPIPQNQWIHIGCAVNVDAKTKALYINGILDKSVTVTGAAITPTTHNTYIGARANNTNLAQESFFTGMLDDVRLYDRALSVDDAAATMTGAVGYGLANTSVPANKAVDVLAKGTILSWTPGVTAVKHDVYFGTDAASLKKVLTGTTATTYAPGTLDFGKVYYWRVDETDAKGTVIAGNVWSFTAELVQYKITSVTPTASSQATGSEATKLTDNSGIDVNGLAGVDPKTMWTTLTDPNQPVTVKFAFDKVYKMAEMWVWNYNNEWELDIGKGIKSAGIDCSIDGTTWTPVGTGTFQFAQADAAEGYAHNTTINLGGVAAKYIRITAKSNWGDAASYGLSEVRFFYTPAFASSPSPANNATGVRPDVTLSWRPGRTPAAHQVYFSTNQAAVADGKVPPMIIPETTFTPADLQLDGTSYYWRVDELNLKDTVKNWAGDVWKFTTATYLTVDDFEAYTNDVDGGKAIYQKWADGYNSNKNGSQVGYRTAPYAEKNLIHGGSQSMPFFFNNTKAEPASEATLTFATPQNWTIGGITTLVMYFRPDVNNVAGSQLYVRINGVKIPYIGSLTAAGVTWKQWNIDVTYAQNVLIGGLDAVQTFTIGVDGLGKGLLFIDDIRLYKNAPALPPTASNPGTSNLVSFFNMENGKVADSVSGVTAVNLNETTFVDSTLGMGKALMCSGGTTALNTQFVDIGPEYWDKVVSKLSNCTFSVWTNYTGVGAIWQRVFDFGCGTNVNTYISSSGATMGIPQFAVKTNVANSGSTGTGYVETLVRGTQMGIGWHHLAGVVNNAGAYPTISIYLDGVLSGGPVAGRLPKDMTLQASPGAWQNYFGKSNWPDPYLNGAVDELRVYNRVLTPGEIFYLAGGR